WKCREARAFAQRQPPEPTEEVLVFPAGLQVTGRAFDVHAPADAERQTPEAGLGDAQRDGHGLEPFVSQVLIDDHAGKDPEVEHRASSVFQDRARVGVTFLDLKSVQHRLDGDLLQPDHLHATDAHLATGVHLELDVSGALGYVDDRTALDRCVGVAAVGERVGDRRLARLELLLVEDGPFFQLNRGERRRRCRDVDAFDPRQPNAPGEDGFAFDDLDLDRDAVFVSAYDAGVQHPRLVVSPGPKVAFDAL